MLRLRLVRNEGERGRINRGDETFENARYYHLGVSNSRPSSPTNDVQVILIRIEEAGPDGTFQVAWVGEVPMRWRNQESSPLTRTIGPEANCDLCCVGERRWLSLMPLITPFSMSATKNARCRIALLLQARSTQADSNVFRAEISWDGVWEDGDAEIQSHLQINVSEGSPTRS